MSSSSAAAAAIPTKPLSPTLLENEDVLALILGWCSLKSIGRIGQCSKSLQLVLRDPNQQFWFGHLLCRLNIPSREVGNVHIASDQSAKSLLKTHIHAESIRPSPRGQPRRNEARWDYHRDDEPTLAIEATNGGWDTYKIDHMVDEESSRYGFGHDFAARYRHSPVPHVPCPVVRRRSGGGKILDVGMSSISYFEVRLVSTNRTGQRQRRPNNALQGDGEGIPQTCVAVGLGSSCFRLSGFQPGWTEDSLGYHSDDGRLFFGTGTDSEPFGASYGDGDIVGCGVHIQSMSVFFTKNGQLIATAYVINTEPRTYRELYPSIGLDSKEFTVHASFGADQAFVFDVSKAERLYEAYPPPLRQSERLSSSQETAETHVDAPNPSDVLKRIGMELAYPEAAAFHPWNKISPTRRIYVQQRDTRRYMWLDSEGESDEGDGHDDDSDAFEGNIDDGLEAMLSDAYDYVSYDDSTYGSGGDSYGDDDDSMESTSDHDD